MFRPVFVLALAAAMAPGLAAQAPQPAFPARDFSATMVVSGSAAPQAMTAKVYRSGQKMRMELPAPPGAYTLTLLDHHTTYMVMNPSMCMQMPMRASGAAQNPMADEGAVRRQPIGTDTVDGHACTVEQITVTPATGPPVTMKAWEANDLGGFPVRIEIQTPQGPMRVEYKAVTLATPDASLFAAPQNCRSMPMGPGRQPPPPARP
ncbi:MAG: hypothetical protein ACRD01_08640 [Terriglobales bacterium]